MPDPKPLLPDGKVDILECSRLATALIRAVRRPQFDSPHEYHETETELRRALHEYAEEIVRAARRPLA